MASPNDDDDAFDHFASSASRAECGPNRFARDRSRLAAPRLRLGDLTDTLTYTLKTTGVFSPVFVDGDVSDVDRIDLDSLQPIGVDLDRPECVLCNAYGDLFVADWRGGVTRIRADGTHTRFTGVAPGGRPLKPNGIALRKDGSFLIADLSPETGGVFSLARDGQVRPLVERIDGIDLPPTNFVIEDRAGRVWITVSTRRVPRILAARPDCADGFIAVFDGTSARIVADGLGYTNEIAFSPDGKWLYVNETFGRRMSRFRVRVDGSLGARETVTCFGHGIYPDGVVFDEAGYAWVTSVVSNRVLRVAPDGSFEVLLEDADASWLDEVERAWGAGAMTRAHLDTTRSRRLKNVSSLAFGGPDRRTAVLGCLQGDRLERFAASVAGLEPVHWHYR